MRKCLVSDVLADFGTRRWRRIPLRARQLHQTSRDTSRPCAHSSDIAMPRHLPISTPRLFDIPTVRLHLDTSAVTGCEIGLAGVLGRACHSVASSAPSPCHSVASSGDNLLANCGFVRFRATRWRRVHRLRATRWRRVARQVCSACPFASLYGVTHLLSCHYEKNRQVTLHAGLARRAALLCDIGLRTGKPSESRRHFTLEATCQAQRSSLPPARVRA